MDFKSILTNKNIKDYIAWYYQQYYQENKNKADLISIQFTPEELVALYKKLIYKTNPIWVNLRDKLRQEKTHCLHCGQEIKKGGEKHESTKNRTIY